MKEVTVTKEMSVDVKDLLEGTLTITFLGKVGNFPAENTLYMPENKRIVWSSVSNDLLYKLRDIMMVWLSECKNP